MTRYVADIEVVKFYARKKILSFVFDTCSVSVSQAQNYILTLQLNKLFLSLHGTWAMLSCSRWARDPQTTAIPSCRQKCHPSTIHNLQHRFYNITALKICPSSGKKQCNRQFLSALYSCLYIILHTPMFKNNRTKIQQNTVLHIHTHKKHFTAVSSVSLLAVNRRFISFLNWFKTNF